MNDTRLLQIKSLARDIEEACAEMLDEGIRDPHAMLHVSRCKAFAAAARKSAAAAEDR